MANLLAILDNRELALLFWMGAAFLWVLWKPAVRRSIGGVLKPFSAKPIVASILLMVAYVYFEVWLLNAVGIWASNQLIATIIWAVTTAAVMLFNINTIVEDEHFFRKTVKENFKLAVLVDFFVNFYALPLVIEIVLLPFATLLVAMVAYCDTDKGKYAVTKRFLNGVLFLLGLWLLIYAFWEASKSIGEITTLETLRSLAAPIILSILYLPFIFLVVGYSAYENAFVRLQFVMKDTSLHGYSKRQMLLRIRFNYPVLKVWLKSAWQRDFESRQDVDASIQEAIEQKN